VTTNNIKLEIVNPLDYPNWNDMVLNSGPDYSIFHTSNWSSVLSDSYGFDPRYFAITEDNKFLFLLPLMEIGNFLSSKKGISLPFTDYCNPIIADSINFSDVLPQLRDTAKQYGWKSFQIRNSNESLINEPVFSSFCRHVLSIQKDENSTFNKFRENYRKNIKRVIKQCKINVGNYQTLESITEYYRLHCMTRKRQGMPPQPFSYFKNIYTHIIAKDLGFITLASVENKNIAGAVFFLFGGKALYKYSASDVNYKNSYASYSVIWEAIRRLSAQGCSELCFGRTDPLHEGLIQFKDGWGTERSTIRYYSYDLEKNSFIHGEQKGDPPGYPILSLLPTPILKLIGSMLYRYGA